MILLNIPYMKKLEHVLKSIKTCENVNLRDICKFDLVVTFKMLQHPNFVYSRAYKALLIPTRYHKIEYIDKCYRCVFFATPPTFLFTL